MKINRTARNILSITAFAWSIPFAQAGDVLNPEAEAKRGRASIAHISQDAVSARQDPAGAAGPAGREISRRFRRVP